MWEILQHHIVSISYLHNQKISNLNKTNTSKRPQIIRVSSCLRHSHPVKVVNFWASTRLAHLQRYTIVFQLEISAWHKNNMMRIVNNMSVSSSSKSILCACSHHISLSAVFFSACHWQISQCRWMKQVKGMRWIYPPPCDHGKWRFIEIRYWKYVTILAVTVSWWRVDPKCAYLFVGVLNGSDMSWLR